MKKFWHGIKVLLFENRFPWRFRSLESKPPWKYMERANYAILKLKHILFLKRRFSAPPIIIGGCARSGTTLLLSILSAHPKIFAIPHETCAFIRNGAFNSITPKKIYEYLVKERRRIPIGCDRWCEKTPANVRYFGKILSLFKNKVKLIDIVRDARDVVTSVHPENPDIFKVPLWRWIKDVKAGMQYEDHPQVYTLKYEDLVLNFNLSIMKLCDFLEIECEKHILSWHDYATVRENFAWHGEVKPLHKESIGRRGGAVFKNLIEEIMSNPEAVTLLRHFNYL